VNLKIGFGNEKARRFSVKLEGCYGNENACKFIVKLETVLKIHRELEDRLWK